MIGDAGPAELLLERDREVESLVEGPAGIGKSRLLAELRSAAQEDDMRVLTARGSELEREFPFGIVRQLFESPLTDAEARERWLAGAAAPARPIFEAEDSHGNGLTSDATFAALHGLYWLTANVAADGPLLLSVDDSGGERSLGALCHRGARDAQDGRGSPHQRVPEAEHRLPARAARRAHLHVGVSP